MTVFALAHGLGRTVQEILNLSVEEFNLWIAYFRIREKENKG